MASYYVRLKGPLNLAMANGRQRNEGAGSANGSVFANDDQSKGAL